MKKFTFTLLIVALFTICARAQSFNTDKTALSNYVTRMYNTSPFEGVKIIDDIDHAYLISVVSANLSSYSSSSTMSKVAYTKAISQMNKFLSGVDVSTDMVVKISDNEDGSTSENTIEIIREQSSGRIDSMEHLTTFQSKNGDYIHVYFKPQIIDPKAAKKAARKAKSR